MPKPKAGPSSEQQLQNLRTSGFEVRAAAGRWQVQKGSCMAVFVESPEGMRFAERPGILIGGEIAHLMDGGYQKFLMSPGRKLPATAEHLRDLHAFQEELHQALGHAPGMTSFYNEALGTVSETYHYDRVKGRPNP